MTTFLLAVAGSFVGVLALIGLLAVGLYVCMWMSDSL